jgi:polysaccharide export outer membrane protein
MTTSAESISSKIGGSANNSYASQFLVEPDGLVKLPIIGKTKVAGLTVREAEKMLEQQYATFYNKPFVLLKVSNRRVLVFPGTGGAGKVVNLDNENTTLIEALALAGGITNTGKAKKIKLIRGDLRNPKVMLINLATVEGVKQSNLLLQANDIIYVEPIPRYSQEVFTQITPIVGIITSLALIYSLAQGL